MMDFDFKQLARQYKDELLISVIPITWDQKLWWVHVESLISLLKGGKWKGCFHIPRALLQCYKVLQQLDSEACRGK